MPRDLRLAVCIELTVPAEERVDHWNYTKGAKYEHLVPEAAENGWQLEVWPVEVGYLGHITKRMDKLMRNLAVPHGQRRTMKQQLEEAALRCTNTLLACRRDATWSNRPLLAVGDRPLHTEAGRPDD